MYSYSILYVSNEIKMNVTLLILIVSRGGETIKKKNHWPKREKPSGEVMNDWVEQQGAYC